MWEIWCNNYCNDPKFSDRYAWANSADPDQTAPRGAVWSGSTLFAIPSASFRLFYSIEPHTSNFRVITTNVLGIQIFRKFMVPEYRVIRVLWKYVVEVYGLLKKIKTQKHVIILFMVCNFQNCCKNLRTDRSGQTVKTQIRLPLRVYTAIPPASFGHITLWLSHVVQILGWYYNKFVGCPNFYDWSCSLERKIITMLCLNFKDWGHFLIFLMMMVYDLNIRYFIIYAVLSMSLHPFSVLRTNKSAVHIIAQFSVSSFSLPISCQEEEKM